MKSDIGVIAVILVAVSALGAAAWFLFADGAPSAIKADGVGTTDTSPAADHAREAARVSTGGSTAIPLATDDANLTETESLQGTITEKSSDAPRLILSGLVLDELDQPVADAEIHLTFTNPDGSMAGLRFSAETGSTLAHKTATDNRGQFTFSSGIPGRQLSLLIRSRRHCDVRHEERLPDTAGNKNLGVFKVREGAVLFGRVTDLEEKPIKGAEVICSPGARTTTGLVFGGQIADRLRSVRSDESGHYRIEGLDDGLLSARVDAPDWLSTHVPSVHVARTEGPREQNFRLSAGGTIRGIVRNESGEPVAGAAINFRSSVVELSERGGGLRRIPSATTDANGRFERRGLPNESLNLTFRKLGYADYRIKQVFPGVSELDIALERSGLVYGYVNDAGTNEPIQEFEVSAGNSANMMIAGMDFERRGPAATILRGDEAAKFLVMESAANLFCVVDVPGTRVRVGAKAPNYGEVVVAALQVKPGERIQKDFKLQRESSVQGVVMDDAGGVVAGADIQIQPKSAEPNVAGARAGRAVRIGGTQTSSEEQSAQQATRSDIDGRFRIGGLRAGEFEIHVSHPKFCALDVIPTKLEVGEAKTDLKIVMSRGGSLKGYTRDADGNVVSAARVAIEVEHIASSSPDAVQTFGEELKSTRSDAEGRYEIQGLAPGRYRAKVSKVSDASGDRVMIRMASNQLVDQGGLSIEIEAGKETKQDLVLEPKASVSGYIKEAGVAVAGAKVSVAAQGAFVGLPGQGWSAISDDRGYYLIEEIDGGELTLEVSPVSAPIPYKESFTLAPRDHQRRDVNLPSGIISGRVVDGDGRGVEGVQVSAEPAQPEGESETVERRVSMAIFSTDENEDEPDVFSLELGAKVNTDHEGRYQLRNLKDGVYRVFAKGGGVIETAPREVSVKEGRKTSDIDFQVVKGSVLLVRTEVGDAGAIRIVTVNCVSETDPSSVRSEVAVPGRTTRIDGLKPGRYQVSGDLNGTERSSSVDLREGETKTVTLSFK